MALQDTALLQARLPKLLRPLNQQAYDVSGSEAPTDSRGFPTWPPSRLDECDGMLRGMGRGGGVVCKGEVCPLPCG